MLKPKVYLPPPRKPEIRRTLVLDLDETLIHCLDDKELACGIKSDIIVKVPYLIEEDGPYSQSHNVAYVDAEINLRPGLKSSLERLSKRFQLVLFTAAESAYADAILEHVDP